GKTTNWFGGSSNASTQLLDGMHYRGMLRVARRDSGVRVYAAREPWPDLPGGAQDQARLDTLMDLAVHKYAPLPSGSLGLLASALCQLAAPQWQADRKRMLDHARRRLARVRIDGVDWYWPADENPLSARHKPHEGVRLLAPFDPVVWDRRRFEAFWGWAYRFEAYTPAPKRQRGYYALPLLWNEQVVGWGNLQVRDGRLAADLGYVADRPRSRAFTQALDLELARLEEFLGL
ncbi:MAG TPA: crosslink repair DNA glycosylase YcaQ family protein, partial [Burkholderiaceae bacterium]|nr:crosslink repair DNA glycosylase YcaQ family protein [Burkholderiaceae bacterium]